MIKRLAVWALTSCCATVAQAQVKSCPPGQILRVSSGVCQPKSAENLRLLKNADGKRKSAQQPAGKTAEANAALRAGKPQPQPSPIVPSAGVPAPVAGAAESSLAVLPIVAPAAKPIEIAAPSAKATPPSMGEAAAAPVPNAANSLANDSDSMLDVVGSVARKRSGPATEDHLVESTPAPPMSAAAQEHGDSDKGQAVASATDFSASRSAPPPLLARDTPIERSDASSGLPDWGDRQAFAEALRADWRGGLVSQTFWRGTQMASSVPLQPVPEPYASRNNTGVPLRYVVANDDIVLVLPLLRVVVDVYPARLGSQAAR